MPKEGWSSGIAMVVTAPSEEATGQSGVTSLSSHLVSRRALHLFQVLSHHGFGLGWRRCTRREARKREEKESDTLRDMMDMCR